MSDKGDMPSCIGFIMDGNRRHARGIGLKTIEGHKKGAEVFVDVVRYVRDAGIPHAVFYGFSSENWNRSEEEVSDLTGIMGRKLDELKDKLLNQNGEEKIRFKFVGDLSKFSQALQDKMNEVEEASKEFTDTTIWVALSYGGRAEIVRAVNSAVEAGAPVDEESFGKLLATPGMPDPDIIVRTGGQQRLSNFLPWQSVYSELYFIDTFWPDFTKEHFDALLLEFKERTRNFGK